MRMPRLGRRKVQKVVVTLQTPQSTAFGKLPESDYAKQHTTAYNSSEVRALSLRTSRNSSLAFLLFSSRLLLYLGHWLRLKGAHGNQSVVRTRRVTVASQHLGIKKNRVRL